MTNTNLAERLPSSPARVTTALREIEGVYRPPGLHWVGDGFRVAGYFSAIADAVDKLSPFLLLDYHPPYEYAPADKPRGGGVLGPGDAQWMTAASGVLHKEYHEQEFTRRGGTFHMAQLWVNLPKAH